MLKNYLKYIEIRKSTSNLLRGIDQHLEERKLKRVKTTQDDHHLTRLCKQIANTSWSAMTLPRHAFKLFGKTVTQGAMKLSDYEPIPGGSLHNVGKMSLMRQTGRLAASFGAGSWDLLLLAERTAQLVGHLGGNIILPYFPDSGSGSTVMPATSDLQEISSDHPDANYLAQTMSNTLEQVNNQVTSAPCQRFFSRNYPLFVAHYRLCHLL